MELTDRVWRAGPLAIAFVRRGDRWGHRIGCMASTVPPVESLAVASASLPRGEIPDGAIRVDPTWLLESIEGTSDEHWPASPPYQELHVESRPHGSVAMLVGRAGRGHWSASVELPDGLAEARFDLACRVPSQPQRLGLEYRLLAPSVSVRAEGETLRVAHRNCELTLTFHALDECAAAWSVTGERCAMVVTVTPGRYPRTVRFPLGVAMGVLS